MIYFSLLLTVRPVDPILYKMNLLLHICCGPCACYSVDSLREEGIDPTGFWYNPNIHPWTENQKRLDTLRTYAKKVNIRLVERDEYSLEKWLRKMVFREDDRCGFCYLGRLKAAALAAKKGGFDAFSSTLLYSRYQKHDLIIRVAEHVSKEVGTPFLYRDFREGWKEGIRISKEMGLYRQQYCGCIYSEKERYIQPTPLFSHSKLLKTQSR